MWHLVYGFIVEKLKARNSIYYRSILSRKNVYFFPVIKSENSENGNRQNGILVTTPLIGRIVPNGQCHLS